MKEIKLEMTSCFPAADYRGKYRHFPPIIFLKWSVCKCENVLIVLYIERYRGIFVKTINTFSVQVSTCLEMSYPKKSRHF